MAAMDDPAVSALVALLKREGGADAVAARIGANPKSLYQIASGRLLRSGRPKGVGRDLREKLERHYPGWMRLSAGAVLASSPPASYSTTGQTNTPADTGKHHAASLTSRSMAPPKISWEALMTTALPQEFETPLPDNAMSPRAARGARCIFVTSPRALPGDWVLVRDRDGAHHVREYRQLRGALWEAHALNPAYLPLHSERDGLTVLAVVDGIRQRMSSAV